MEGNKVIICESTKSGPTTGIRANVILLSPPFIDSTGRASKIITAFLSIYIK